MFGTAALRRGPQAAAGVVRAVLQDTPASNTETLEVGRAGKGPLGGCYVSAGGRERRACWGGNGVDAGYLGRKQSFQINNRPACQRTLDCDFVQM